MADDPRSELGHCINMIEQWKRDGGRPSNRLIRRLKRIMHQLPVVSKNHVAQRSDEEQLGRVGAAGGVRGSDPADPVRDRDVDPET